jgi:hypothetical protein
MALGSTQLVTAIGKCGRCVGLANLSTPCTESLEIVVSSTSWIPNGPMQTCNGLNVHRRISRRDDVCCCHIHQLKLFKFIIDVWVLSRLWNSWNLKLGCGKHCQIFTLSPSTSSCENWAVIPILNRADPIYFHTHARTHTHTQCYGFIRLYFSEVFSGLQIFQQKCVCAISHTRYTTVRSHIP